MYGADLTPLLRQGQPHLEKARRLWGGKREAGGLREGERRVVWGDRDDLTHGKAGTRPTPLGTGCVGVVCVSSRAAM